MGAAPSKSPRSSRFVDFVVPWNINPRLNLETLGAPKGFLYADPFNETRFKKAALCFATWSVIDSFVVFVTTHFRLIIKHSKPC